MTYSPPEPAWLTKQRARIERARGPFEAIRDYMGLADWGRGAPVGRRLHDALAALREWRNANNQNHSPSDDLMLSVRIVADQLASEIEGAAGPEHDRATVAWVLAGMRCPLRPFCTGCRACFTITSPHRPND